MGDVADMMLDGTLCECCGVYIEGEAQGFPRYCSTQCARGRGRSEPHPLVRKVNCPHCQRRVKEIGLKDHIRDVHPSVLGKKENEVNK